MVAAARVEGDAVSVKIGSRWAALAACVMGLTLEPSASADARPADPAAAAAPAAGGAPPLPSRAKLVLSFEGLGRGFSGPQGQPFNPRNPSDISLAVGPNHIVQIVNTRMAVFTKAGEMFGETGRPLYGPVETRNVFRGFGGPCEAINNGDAVARYDQLADRWLIVMPIFTRVQRVGPQPPTPKSGEPPMLSEPGRPDQPGPAQVLFQPAATPEVIAVEGRVPERPKGPETGTYAMCYAISATPDPLGAWYRYEFVRPLFPDYPRPAVWPDGYYVPTSTGDTVIQKHDCVVERAKMLQGKPARELCVIVDGVNFLNNADLDGKALPPAGAPNTVVAAGGTQLKGELGDDALYFWKFHVDWEHPARSALSGPLRLQVTPYRYQCGGQLTRCAPQPRVEMKLDSQGDKITQRFVYRRLGGDEALVATQSVDDAAGGGAVRWYEFRLDHDRNPVVRQEGDIAPDAGFRWMPSVAMDRFGNIGVGYSFGDARTYPGQRFAGRLADDPPGAMGAETALVHGQAAQGDTLRWEDYTTTAIDPSDDCTMWYVGDYLRTGDAAYSTRIGAFQLGECGRR
jgi:hypothetical protein